MSGPEPPSSFAVVEFSGGAVAVGGAGVYVWANDNVGWSRLKVASVGTWMERAKPTYVINFDCAARVHVAEVEPVQLGLITKVYPHWVRYYSALHSMPSTNVTVSL